jgi:hypothetical protein
MTVRVQLKIRVSLVVSLRGLGDKSNCFALIRQSQSNSDCDSSVSAVEWSSEPTVVRQSPASKNVSTEAKEMIGSRYQTTGKHTED